MNSTNASYIASIGELTNIEYSMYGWVGLFRNVYVVNLNLYHNKSGLTLNRIHFVIQSPAEIETLNASTFASLFPDNASLRAPSVPAPKLGSIKINTLEINGSAERPEEIVLDVEIDIKYFDPSKQYELGILFDCDKLFQLKKCSIESNYQRFELSERISSVFAREISSFRNPKVVLSLSEIIDYNRRVLLYSYSRSLKEIFK
ncbi:MAG: hypothetical protein J0L75_09925 [Spirochaetes bacterium]|nr:hypothetical protein [Spirochaetota bacterium]